MPYFLIVDRDGQEYKDVIKILTENNFFIRCPPNHWNKSLDMAVFDIRKDDKKAYVRFVSVENYDLWRGYIYNIITFQAFKRIFEKQTIRMATLTIPHDNC